jgi:2-polyprenyl-3-methyl-5-hydroxy-6-metoxy-1,4-benzoquinol methylase
MAMITSCILCRSVVLRRVAIRRGVIVYRCPTCELLQAQERKAFISGDDHNGAVATAPAHFEMLVKRDDDWRGAMRKILAARMPWIEARSGGAMKNWLEIGPGNGGLGQLLVEAGAYWKGVEIDSEMAARMHQAGKNVMAADFSKLSPDEVVPDHLKEAGGFDIIFLSQVLEHVTAPAQFLANALACLRYGGLIYIDVPNNTGLTAVIRNLNAASSGYGEIVPPHHMIAYGAKTLSFALRGAGFQNIEVFSKAYNDPAFGLVHAHLEKRLKLKVIWQLSRLVGMGGNLIAVATKAHG